MRLRDILHNHPGEHSAIPSPSLARITGLSERTIREAVNSLIEAGDPIGSTTRGGGGYYWIITEPELQAAVGQLRARAKEITDRADRLIAAFHVGRRQTELVMLRDDDGRA